MVADGFEHQTAGVAPEHGVVRRRVLGIFGRRVDDLAAELDHPLVYVSDPRSGWDHERQVLEAGTFAAIRSVVTRGVEEQERAGLASGWLIGELVVVIEEHLEVEQAHDGAVIFSGQAEVGNVQTEVTDHRLSVAQDLEKPKPGVVEMNTVASDF